MWPSCDLPEEFEYLASLSPLARRDQRKPSV